MPDLLPVFFCTSDGCCGRPEAHRGVDHCESRQCCTTMDAHCYAAERVDDHGGTCCFCGKAL
ncbi:MAG: hypothetical protein JWP11_3817 [Frankiales bacterium]|nr:hypothetical protein [Frankiales bacterium]